MRPIKNLFIALFILLAIFSNISPVSGHVEENSMPDPEAEMEYRILLEFEPDNYDVRLKLGMVLFRAEKYSEAADQFNYVVTKDPGNCEALISLARVKIMAQEYHQAVTLLQKALPIDPDDMHTYYFLGQALEMQGDISGAQAIYRNGLDRRIPPQNKHALEERQLLVEALNKLQNMEE
jgi:predicted Zn-dependent protease